MFFQIFAIYLSKYDSADSKTEKGNFFWLETATVYGIQSVSLLLTSLLSRGDREIYSSMGLVNVFTMLFVTILSVITIFNHKDATPTD